VTTQLFTVPALVHGAAKNFGDDIAVTDGTTALTFTQLRVEAARTAAVLRGRGIRRGDRVGVCMAKSTEQAVAILGVLLADAVIVPILPALKHDNIAHITKDAGLSAAITDATRVGELRSAAPDVPLLFGEAAPGEPDDAVLPLARAAHGPGPVASRVISEDLAAIIYSSGSTGRPKGIMVTHRNLWHGALITAGYLGTRREDRIGSVLSLNFDYGLNQLWQCLLTGARLCLHELVFPKTFFRFLVDEGITVLPVMPVIISRMFDARLLRSRPANLSGIRSVCTSGGPVTPRMIEQVGQTFPNADFVLMYGLTEAFRSTYLEPDQLALRPGSIGRAIPDVEILVLNDDLAEVGPGERGELVHRGGCVSKGYWNAPDETAKRFRSLPWLPGETVVFSGDVVTRDEDGYLYFVGRRDAMIKTSGFRVSPTEVEEVAARFPGIDLCVAVGVADADLGEKIALAYASAGDIDEDAFRAFLRDGLPSHMVPGHLVPMDELPATGNQGKVDRQTVAESVRDRLA
jgi:amino acid adenylation domain-containing protein